MYDHFVCQLSNTTLMDSKKKYKKQLDDIDKQHKFIILRTLHSGNYETEMNRFNDSRKTFIISMKAFVYKRNKGFKTLQKKKYY